MDLGELEFQGSEVEVEEVEHLGLASRLFEQVLLPLQLYLTFSPFLKFFLQYFIFLPHLHFLQSSSHFTE